MAPHKNRTRLLTTGEAALFFSPYGEAWFRQRSRIGFSYPGGAPIEPDEIDYSHPIYPKHLWSIETLQACAESLLRYGRMTPEHFDLVMRRLALFLPGALKERR